MYLRQLPTYYTNGTETVAVYYATHARDLEDEGWKKVEKEKEAPAEVLPETKIDYVEVQEEQDLGQMTKKELIAYAEENAIDVNPQETKAEILQAIYTGGNG